MKTLALEKQLLSERHILAVTVRSDRGGLLLSYNRDTYEITSAGEAVAEVIGGLKRIYPIGSLPVVITVTLTKATQQE